MLTQYGGTTVEVQNTDAEGRLILADAIVRACEDNPDYLIETSTLTGAQTVALGARIPGVMGSDEFRDRVAAISQRVGENGWPMPLPDELKEDLKSTVADLSNISGQRFAGMLVAGVFLREFVADGVGWAHIDVAGPAYNTGSPWGYSPKGATGCRRAPCSRCSKTSPRTAKRPSAIPPPARASFRRASRASFRRARRASRWRGSARRAPRWRDARRPRKARELLRQQRHGHRVGGHELGHLIRLLPFGQRRQPQQALLVSG